MTMNYKKSKLRCHKHEIHNKVAHSDSTRVWNEPNDRQKILFFDGSKHKSTAPYAAIYALDKTDHKKQNSLI